MSNSGDVHITTGAGNLHLDGGIGGLTIKTGDVFGDNATAVHGNHNTVSVNNTVNKGDFSALARALKEKGVAESDISGLRNAIAADKDAPEHSQRGFGTAVKGWISNMLSMAVNGAWQIELGIAANFLTDALKSYYFS